MFRSVVLLQALSLASIALAAPSAVGCVQFKEEPLATLAGPEVDDLLPRASGHVVLAQSGALVAVSLPDCTRKILFWPTEQSGSVSFASGPDREGRVVFVTDGGLEPLVRVRTACIDGTGDTLLLERKGDVLWLSSIGAPALAPTGGLVAFVWNAKPGFDGETIGPLEVRDITKPAADATSLVTGITASDRGLAWFSDGRHLAFVELLSPRDAREVERHDKGFATNFTLDGRVPVITILDVGTGAQTRLHIGDRPLVAPGGSFLLLQDGASTWWRMNPAGGELARVAWPGDWLGPVALVSDDLLLYRGLPTEGTPAQHTWLSSPVGQRHAMGDLKLAVLDTDRFQTVIRGIDPRFSLGFGGAAP